MLGTVTDAEDIVHDVFMELEIDIKQIKDVRAYLAKMTTNRCINFLKSARNRREVYTGPWLPEPQVSQTEQPLDKVIKNETVSYAFIVLLDQLSPAERAVFVLREAFAYSYEGIADVLEKSEVNCRQIYSRAKRKLKYDLPISPENTKQADSLVKAFIEAANTGNFDEMIDMLAEDVVLITDGGGKVLSALKPIINRERVLAFIKGVTAKTEFTGELSPVMVNGEPGILRVKEGTPMMVVSFKLDSKKENIQSIFAVTNPDKLSHISVL